MVVTYSIGIPGFGRRLHGRRGLKCKRPKLYDVTRQPSPPSRAAWIEIVETTQKTMPLASPPSRAAWIEIYVIFNSFSPYSVAAFTGGVD